MLPSQHARRRCHPPHARLPSFADRVKIGSFSSSGGLIYSGGAPIMVVVSRWRRTCHRRGRRRSPSGCCPSGAPAAAMPVAGSCVSSTTCSRRTRRSTPARRAGVGSPRWAQISIGKHHCRSETEPPARRQRHRGDEMELPARR